MKFILGKKIKYYTKEIIKLSKIMTIALIGIIGIICIKFKPIYEVEINNIEIGYVQNKEQFNSAINEEIEQENQKENVAFITLNTKPSYTLKLVLNKQETNEEEVLENIKEEAIETTYTAYGIALDDNIETYVSSEEEAKEIVDSVKEEYKEKNIDVNLDVKQVYTQNDIEISKMEEAKEKVTQNTQTKIEISKEIEIAKTQGERKVLATINGVEINYKPVKGVITSRYGEVSNIRSSWHTGLDIGASTGTDINACSDGVVSFAGYSGSYGNLVKVQHSNGVETWYGHCSKILVSKGQEVKAGEKIAEVGSTGNSTGPHLHFEIRINGSLVNPQKYLYK